MKNMTSILTRIRLGLLALSLACIRASAGEVTIDDLAITGRITGEDFSFDVAFRADASRVGAQIPVVSGEVGLVSAASGPGWRLTYDAKTKSYALIVLEGDAPVEVKASFVAKSSPDPKNAFWHTASIVPPAAHVRKVEIEADREDLELELPGTLQRREETRNGHLVVSALLRPEQPLSVRWKAQVEVVEAKLLAASEANTILTLSPGTLRADALFVYAISQGALTELTYGVPKQLSVTQVRGDHLRDWHLQAGDDSQTLVVRLSREQAKQYRIQILAEMALPPLPGDAEIPVIVPRDGTRADGFLAMGTNSAIQLQVKQSTGVSQIDAAAFPRVTLAKDQPRAIPESKTFYYSFAATPYQMGLSLADIVPSFDVDERLTVTVKDDDMTIDAEMEFDVRDAPIRRVKVALPDQMVVAGVTGKQISDYSVSAPADAGDGRRLVVEFREAVLGRALIQFKLELGQTPIGTTQALAGLTVDGARNERGFIAVVTESGVLIENPEATELRQVHTRAIPMRVPNAQFAWRFREPTWRLALPVKERPSNVRAEAFHLLSLGDGVAYGSVALTYFIAGAPVDELTFRISPKLRNVEFIGLDVSRWTNEEDLWRVKLRRKVIGDYNLGVTFSQRYKDGESVLAGAITCDAVETQTGFLTVSSHRSLQLSEERIDSALIPIGSDETPSQYRLLVSAPILRTYKYVTTPHDLELKVEAYDRGATPTVIVEFVNARTDLSLDDRGNAESVTRVRYTVKNSSAQFLDIVVPEGLNIWGTRLIRKLSNGAERAQRVQAARDGDRLKIPLKRQQNPNAPLTVELEYGQVHGRLGWSGDLRLGLPGCLVQSTYADWHIQAPAGWILRPGQSGTVGAPSAAPSKLPTLGRNILHGWRRSVRGTALAFSAILVGVLAACAIIFRNRGVAILMVAVTLLALTLFGFQARNYASRMGSYATAQPSIALNQVLNLDADTPVSAAVHVLKSWRQRFSVGASVGFGVAALALIGAAVASSRWRKPAVAGAVTALLLGGLQFDVGILCTLHVLTWGLPAAALVNLCICGAASTIRGRKGAPAPPAAAAILLLLLPLSAEARKAPPKPPPGLPAAVHVVVERSTCDITVQEDSVTVDLALTVSSKEGGWLPVAPSAAILLAKPEGGVVALISENGHHALAVGAGTHQATLQLLLPLPSAGDDHVRRFSMPLPVALATQLNGTIPGKDLDVDIAGAVSTTVKDTETAATFTAILSPVKALTLTWKPRERRTQLEETVFYAEVVSLARADSGLVEGLHHVDLRVAQGELSRVEIGVPKGMTVTRVNSPLLGSWRFDPAGHRLQVGLEQPVTGDCTITLVTQVSANSMPYAAQLRGLSVVDASRQRASLGLLASSAVNLAVRTHPQPMNTDDFRRAAAVLLEAQKKVWGQDVLYAYRMSDPEASVAIEVTAVTAELRTEENASFSIADERLVFNTVLVLDISKSGLFAIDLDLPTGYDVDSLSCAEISHWDETEADGRRVARIHFQKQLLGSTSVTVALSQSVGALPAVIPVPRIGVADVLKHRGQLVVSAERGVRLSVAERDGISELDVAQLQMRTKPALAFKLLRPNWALRFETETLTPRINVQFLHLANVSDGLVKHRQYLRYRLQNAGTKLLEFTVPPDALGLLITGPEIARKELVDAETGLWRVELSGKWFDRAYPLEISYETRFDREVGGVPIVPIKASEADLQRGFVVVRTSPRVELASATVGPSLQPAEARAVPTKFGAGDLADAAFCYTSSTPDYELSFKATRHDAADLLKAKVLRADLISVVNRQRDSIHQVALSLRSGGKRYLRTELPAGARIWSLLVDRQSRTPSLAEVDGRQVLQVPLPQSTGGELSVAVEMIYVLPRPTEGSIAKQAHQGPRFDLPLNNITWVFYVPERYAYSDFEGTMTPDKQSLARDAVAHYDIRTYEEETRQANDADLQKAVQLQQQGLQLAKRGNQKGARQALEQAFNYSQADKSLNEDARVNLRNLLKQQAVVGLVGRRNDVRSINNDIAVSAADQSVQVAQQQGMQINAPGQQLGDTFTQEEAERLQNSLSKDDSQNLEQITNRMIEIQEAAAGVALQLMVKPPLHGRTLVFRRALQVEPDAEMKVSFRAAPKRAQSLLAGLPWAGGAFVVLLLVLTLPGRVTAGWVCCCGCGKGAKDEAKDEPATDAEAAVDGAVPADAPVDPVTGPAAATSEDASDAVLPPEPDDPPPDEPGDAELEDDGNRNE
ncbi:MAG: hypothetical protein HN742_35675 [Lentisphaerae bacterium]|jgi:hypothetical protein|nr:hypothetical protein [Lentisphaerota bacterium]MBT5608974.1 hypothetical protein [Lentisphaerota bacterium]MBT7057533.1 hypothetical protein [Lentisphaerota bacterium]MBT7847265.1 hypothetical protein [Lentisphaerota bacterium]